MARRRWARAESGAGRVKYGAGLGLTRQRGDAGVREAGGGAGSAGAASVGDGPGKREVWYQGRGRPAQTPIPDTSRVEVVDKSSTTGTPKWH